MKVFSRKFLGVVLVFAFLAGTTVFSPANAAGPKILSVGDSITAGNNSPSWRWPLFQRFAMAGYVVEFLGPFSGGSNPSDSLANPMDGQVVNGQTFHSYHNAVWGISSKNLGYNPIYHPDIAIIHLGTNDYYDDGGGSPDQYGRFHIPNWQQTFDNYDRIISAIRADNPNVVVLLSLLIPDDTALAPQINLAIPGWAAQHAQTNSPIIVIDNFTGYDHYRMNQTDATHPNSDGEDYMAQNFFDALIPYLGTPSVSYPNYAVLATPTYVLGTVGQSFNYQFVTTMPATNITVSGLPAGLTYNSGSISGIPTAATAPAPPPGGTANNVMPDPVTICAINAAGTYTQIVNIAIKAPYPNPNAPAAIPGTIFCANYDSGGLRAGYLAYDNSLSYFRVNYPNFQFAGNWTGPYRFEDIGIGACNDTTNNGYCLASAASQQWVDYTVSAATSGTYQLQVRYASPYTKFIHVLVDGVNVTLGSDVVNQFILPVTGSDTSWATATAPYNFSLTAGLHTIQVWLDDSPRLNWMNFTCLGAPTVVITSPLSYTGTVGTAFSYQITASGSPTNYNATGLPSGLNVNATNGLISGTPLASGNSSVTISANSGAGSGQATLSLTINPGMSAPVINSPTVATGMVGQAFIYQITASGNPTSFNATGLPPWLTVNTNNGAITGTPTTNGVTNVTISAMNSYGTNSTTLTITINPAGTGPTGLAGWWKLDESAGTTAADSSGNGNNGTLSAGTWQPSGGHIAGALHLNAFDVVNCGAGASLNTPSVTVAFWMKPDSVGNVIPVDKLPVTVTVGYAVKLRDNGSIWFRVGAEGGPAMDVYGANGIYTNGVWIHVACTFNSGNGAMRMYINGVVESHQPSFAVALNASNTTFRMGSTVEQYAGLLDDVRVYDHALASNEISVVMAGGSVSNVAPPLIMIGPKSSQPGMIELSWSSAAGANYEVYKTTNLLVSWPTQALTNIVGDGAAKVFSEQWGTLKTAYYRLKAVGS